MTRVLLLRHAPTAETGRRLSGRRPGIPLDDAGRAQAVTARPALDGVRLTAAVTSPVQRCRETLEVVLNGRGPEPVVDAAFEEVNFGTWQGRTLTQLRGLKAWATVQSAPSRFRFPEGESFAEVQARAVAGLERLAAVHPRGTVIVCSHADVIKLVVSYHLGQPIDLFQRIAIDPASISVIELHPGRAAHVVSVNGRYA